MSSHKWMPTRSNIYHLFASYKRANAAEFSHAPVCGVDDPETVTRPDGLDYCRHCIVREGDA